jgi:dTDP-4-amino-4,6-dideoxygalactose transaminase
LDPELVERAITRQTKAILPVHLYGQAADLDRLQAIAKSHDLLLIEDAAQAHGALHNGRRVGSIGDAGCFSFYPGKNLGAFGEAGAVVTNDSGIADRIRRLRDHAQQGRHNHVELGFNTRMEGIQGAVLSVKLRYLDEWNAARRRHARLYEDLLATVPGIVVPRLSLSDAHVWHLYVVLVPHIQRDRLQAELLEQGVSTGVHYPVPVPFQPAYHYLGYSRGDFPVAESVMQSCLSLPMFPELSANEVEYVAATLRHKVSQAQQPAGAAVAS